MAKAKGKGEGATVAGKGSKALVIAAGPGGSITEGSLVKANKAFLDKVSNAVAGPIRSTADFEGFLTLGRQVKEHRARIAAYFKPEKQRLDLEKKAVLNRERSIDAPWEPVDRMIRDKTAAYAAEVERKAVEQRQRLIERAQEKGDEAKVDALIVAPVVDRATTTASASGVGLQDDVDIEVVDIWAVPHVYLREPEVRVREVKAAYLAGTVEIEGLRLTACKRTVYK